MAAVSSATTGCIPCRSNRELLRSLLFKSKNIGITLPFNHVNYTRYPITITRFLIRSSTSDQSEPASSSSSSTTAMEEGELGDDTNPVMEVPKGSPSLISALNVEKALRGIAITDADHYGRLGLSIGCSYDQVRVAYKNKVDELSTQGLDDEEEYNKRLELLKESYTILSTEEERRLYDWSLARSEKPDRYVWPFEVDITQAPKGTPPPPEPEDVGPTRLVGYFILGWVVLSFMLSIAFNL